MTGHRRPFRFSVQAFQAESAREWTDTARQAEDLGYATLFTTDHYFGPGAIAEQSGHRPVDVAPIAASMAAAAVTTTLRVGCRVFCVDYHQPVALAKELATLDLLSGGRLEVGLGAGWVAAEYDGMGIPMDRPGVRIERLEQVADLIKAHWRGEDLDIDRSHVHATGFAGRHRPV
jgi:alkanesulfonate monooxygenase SsuD/methylene tetrahydromethanopterin reductase-like flavin-dependent oxidoreductase (luciferase family)